MKIAIELEAFKSSSLIAIRVGIGYESIGYKSIGYKSIGYKSIGYKSIGYSQLPIKTKGDQ
jgi:hypothetical protein